jgi:nucleoside 2-deoxyribosyltransferase
MLKVYIASKIAHAEQWRNFYSLTPSIHLVSRWPFLIPFIQEDQSKKFWQEDLADIQACDVLVVYAQAGEKLRGALVEAGMALALNKPVVVIGDHPDYGTWSQHPLVSREETISSFVGNSLSKKYFP